MGARELGQLSLDDALKLCMLLAERDPRRFDEAGMPRYESIAVRGSSATSGGAGLSSSSRTRTRAPDRGSSISARWSGMLIGSKPRRR
jgi:hypothetical protein